MGRKVERTRAGGQWTEARYWSFIRGALRMAFMKYPVKHQVLKAAQVPKPPEDEGRHHFIYPCADCGELFKHKDVQVDHIKEAGSLRKYSDLPGFVERLFCEADNLQILCTTCHKDKTHGT